jgi:hypothetical protein
LKGLGVSDPIPASKLGGRNAGFSNIILSGWNSRKRDTLAKKMKAVLLKYSVAYQVSRFQTGQNVDEWMVVV